MSSLSPEKLNAHSIPTTDDDDMTWHDPPSSPFVSHIEHDQENIAPPNAVAPTPVKALIDFGDDVPQSAFKVSSPSKNSGLRERGSPMKTSPAKQLLDELQSAHTTPFETIQHLPDTTHSANTQEQLSPSKRSSSSHTEAELRENEGLTVAMQIMQEMHREESHESSSSYHVHTEVTSVDDASGIEDTDFHPDGPELTSVDMDDTCFSAFSEMPGLDLTKFAVLRKSPTKSDVQATPRARVQMTPSTVRRAERTPSPTPRRMRKDNDTTNLLLDFTAQIEAFSASRRGSPAKGRTSPTKSTTEPNLLSYIQNQRSPAKGSRVPATPSQNRQLLNLLDFELPPPPTPRSVPTVTIRELESLKSTFQSQISSLSASLSGKEAEVESLVKAVADAERRVGEAQELVRDERSAREHAEAQMADWKKKGEEVQKLLQDVQAELARNDTERETLLSRLAEAEKRAEEAEQRSSDLETRAIEAESKNVDMTTFINPAEDEENKKIYSEAECQAAIAEKVNDVARDLHTAYKAKHEKKIKALKENYQKKADERCKELRVQIIRLERQVEEAEKKRDDTFSKVLPAEFANDSAKRGDTCEKCGKDGKETTSSNDEDLKRLEAQKSEIENLKAKLAGLQTELSSLRKSHDVLLQDLEAERVEKGELVAAAEQMLSLCGEKMEEMQQEELRKSQIGGAPPTAAQPEAMRNTGFLAGGAPTRPGSALGAGRPGSAMGERLGAMGGEKASGIAKPSGLRAPGGFGFQGAPGGLNRSTSGGKSRLMSNIERMGGRSQQE